MAWTQTKLAQYAAGNQNVQHWKLTADSASSELITGLGNVLTVAHAYGSAATASRAKYALNVLSAATAQGGAVSITSMASGDDLYVTVIGN